MVPFRWPLTDRKCARRFAEQSAIRTYHGEMDKELPILYTKQGCPWCHEAVEFLDEHGVGYRLKDVSSDSGAFSEMQRKSGQTKAPTLDWNGKILADFGTDELVPFLRERGVKLEDS
jgi:glutaredoxin 3